MPFLVVSNLHYFEEEQEIHLVNNIIETVRIYA